MVGLFAEPVASRVPISARAAFSHAGFTVVISFLQFSIAAQEDVRNRSILDEVAAIAVFLSAGSAKLLPFLALPAATSVFQWRQSGDLRSVENVATRRTAVLAMNY